MRLPPAAALVALLSVAATAAAEVAEPTYSFPDRADGARGTRLRLTLRAGLDDAWRAVSRPGSATRLFDHVRAIEPVEGRAGVYLYRLRYPVGERRILCSVTRDEARHRVRWRRVGGDFEAFEGLFQVRPAAGEAGRVQVDYESWVNPGGIARLMLTPGRRQGLATDLVRRLRALLER